MRDAVKDLLNDQRSMKEAAIVVFLVPCIYFGMDFIGWGNNMFSWWEKLLAGPIMGFCYWLFLSGFRRFRDEDVTPS